MALYIGNKKYCAVKRIGVNNQDILITANGNYTAEEEYSGFGVVRVQVPEAVLTEITVDATTETQTIEPLNDGFSKVIVNPVTAAIDPDIIASNIKKDVNILGVTGTLEFTTEELSVSPTIAQQVFEPTANGYSKVTISGVTYEIDSNITAANIRKDVKILGVTGTLIESNETTRNITENGLYEVEAPYTGFSSVDVDVEAQLDELNITPMITEQTFTSQDKYHGFSPVHVAAVTSSIDANIKPENIKQGITILGVTGTVIELDATTITIDPQINQVVETPPEGYNAFSQVTVNAVTADIDPDIIATNIKQGVNILGVTGTVIELQGTTLTLNPTTSQQIKTPTAPYNGYTSVTVNAVTSSIDSNIQPENIKDGVTILGVEGTCVELNTTTLTINPSTQQQSHTPASPYNGYSSVTVNPVTSAIDADIQPGNIKKDVEILGVTGTLEFTTEELTVNPSTSLQEFEPTEDGYSKVTVNAVTASIDSDIIATNIKQGVNILGVVGSVVEVNNQTLSVTDNGTFVPDEGYTGFSSVEVNVISAVNTNLHIIPSGQPQEFTPPEGYTGFDEVTVEAVSAAADANIKPENIVKGITILGVTGTAELVLQEKHVTIDASTPTITTYTPDQDGCNGYSKFIFDLSWLEDQLQALNAGDSNTSLALQTKTVTTSGTVTADTGYDGLGSVIVDLSAYEQQIADLQAQIAQLEAQLN